MSKLVATEASSRQKKGEDTGKRLTFCSQRLLAIKLAKKPGTSVHLGSREHKSLEASLGALVFFHPRKAHDIAHGGRLATFRVSFGSVYQKMRSVQQVQQRLVIIGSLSGKCAFVCPPENKTSHKGLVWASGRAKPFLARSGLEAILLRPAPIASLRKEKQPNPRLFGLAQGVGYCQELCKASYRSARSFPELPKAGALVVASWAGPT